MLANLVDSLLGAPAQGLSYPDREVAVSPQVVVDSYPRTVKEDVSQFGADYIELRPTRGAGTLQIDFSGQPEVGIIPAAARSGSHIWWSNRGDVSNMTLTRDFDLRGVDRATLTFDLWTDIEEHFDYAYIEVSTDTGATWDTLKGTHTTTANPNGNNFGNGYTGKSADRPGAEEDGWVEERIDLGAYAGKEISLRFEYITDDGYNAQGVAIDNVAIPELGYNDDAETDTGWKTDGFVRVHNALPQRYFLAMVRLGQSGFDVQPVEVSRDGTAAFTVEGLGPDGEYNKAVLVVAGTTPHSIRRASYELNVRSERNP
jgi:hypothetical protein